MTNELKTFHKISKSLKEGIKIAGLEFQMGEIPKLPVSSHDVVNELWYSPDRILSHDLEEKINFANPTALKKFGYELFEFIGMPSINLVPNDPELRAKRAEAFRKIIETGRPEYFENSPRVQRDGSKVPVTGWVFRYRLDGQYTIGALLLP